MKPLQAADAATISHVFSHSFEVEYQNRLGG